jgi:Heterokaryon incompatibility protein (HET)
VAPTSPKSSPVLDLVIPFIAGAIPGLCALAYNALHKKPKAGGASNRARISVDRRAGRRGRRMENPIDSSGEENDFIEVGMRNKFTPYKHIPLQSPRHIRVIQLYPSASKEADLYCRILQMDVDRINDRGIEAISYCWGPPVKPGNDLYCHNATNSSPASSVLKIGTSLHSALVRFRHKSEFRWVWADAVCIHQKNDLEKSSQVRHMAKIYAKASHTLIWLGKGNGSDEKCVEFFKQLPASATEEWTIQNSIK